MAITFNNSVSVQKPASTGPDTSGAGVPQLAVSFGNPAWNELVVIYAHIQKEYYAAVEANLATVILFGSLELSLAQLTVLVRGLGSRMAYLSYRHFADLADQRRNGSLAAKHSKCASETADICRDYDAPVKALLPTLIDVLNAGSTSAQVSDTARPRYNGTLLTWLFSIELEVVAA